MAIFDITTGTCIFLKKEAAVSRHRRGGVVVECQALMPEVSGSSLGVKIIHFPDISATLSRPLCRYLLCRGYTRIPTGLI